MITSTILLASTIVLNQPLPVDPTAGMPYIKISRVEQVDNLDQGDWVGANRADFYAEVTVNGEKTKTEVIAKDDGKPDWKIELDPTARLNDVTIRLMDDDGGFEREDDHADISPRPKQKDLEFTYDTRTGQIWGDIDGWAWQTLISQGWGDDDKAKITFMLAR